MGGQTLPTACTKVNTVLVSPWSAGTLLYKGFFTSPRSLSSFGTFCTLISFAFAAQEESESEGEDGNEDIRDLFDEPVRGTPEITRQTETM